jgi:hypothetical protein
MAKAMTNPTPSEFDAKLKDAIAYEIWNVRYVALDKQARREIDRAVAAIRAAVREIVPKKRTIDNDHEYIDNTFNKGRNAAIAEMWAKLAAPQAPNERK